MSFYKCKKKGKFMFEEILVTLALSSGFAKCVDRWKMSET